MAPVLSFFEDSRVNSNKGFYTDMFSMSKKLKLKLNVSSDEFGRHSSRYRI